MRPPIVVPPAAPPPPAAPADGAPLPLDAAGDALPADTLFALPLLPALLLLLVLFTLANSRPRASPALVLKRGFGSAAAHGDHALQDDEEDDDEAAGGVTAGSAGNGPLGFGEFLSILAHAARSGVANRNASCPPGNSRNSLMVGLSRMKMEWAHVFSFCFLPSCTPFFSWNLYLEVIA